jgi:hypothetical protein
MTFNLTTQPFNDYCVSKSQIEDSKVSPPWLPLLLTVDITITGTDVEDVLRYEKSLK